MGIRFWKRIRLSRLVTLNLSKNAISVSLGPRGAHYTAGTKGKRLTVGIPGTGLFYTAKTHGRTKDSGSDASIGPRCSAGSSSQLAESARKVSRKKKQAALECYEAALRDLTHGTEQTALERLRAASGLPDAAFLAGVIVLRLEKPSEEAEKLFSHALNSSDIGSLCPPGVLQVPLGLTMKDGNTVLLPWDSAGAEVGLGIAEHRLGNCEQARARIEEVLLRDARYEYLRAVCESMVE